MNFLRWLKWLPKLMRELCRRGLVPVFYSSPFLSCLLYLAITLSTFSYDANSKESRLIIAKEAKGPTSSVHTTKAQLGISQTTQWPKSLLVLEGGDITIGEALEMTILDPGLGLPALILWSSTASLRATFTVLGHPLPVSCDSLYLLRACHSWRDCSKFMGTSLVGLGEACSWATF